MTEYEIVSTADAPSSSFFSQAVKAGGSVGVDDHLVLGPFPQHHHQCRDGGVRTATIAVSASAVCCADADGRRQAASTGCI